MAEYEALPEWYGTDADPQVAGSQVGVNSGDSNASSWVSYIPSIFKSAAQAVTGVLQTKQGVYTDVYGRLWQNGQLVTNYAPSGTLSGLVSGLSLTTLLILAAVLYFALRE
jgi:flagellar biosynthesis component FlhA